MKIAPSTLAVAVCLGGCVTGAPDYVLTGGEVGVFRSANAGRPIPLDRIKGMDEREVIATFGAPLLDRKDEPARVLRFQSDACTLFVSLYRSGNSEWRASFAEAYDPQLRPLPSVDQCAGSVATQKKRLA
ncbi:MAG: hypothetical protein KIT25_22420 [Enhydrobacter sp.]|nr:MAG: hypothetical protein KIT25_22420 [Enhydrobacter sp.]